MADDVYELHARVCQALSSPVRLRILDQLRDGERSVKHLVAAVGASQPNLSLHLKVLAQGGVVLRRQEGTAAYYRVACPEVFQAIDILRGILTRKLTKEDRMLRRTPR